MDERPPIPSVRGKTFDDVLDWARGGDAFLSRQLQEAVRAYAKAHRTRLHLAAAATTRRLLELVTRMGAITDALQAQLMDGARLKHMRTQDLISLLNVTSRREAHAMNLSLDHANGAATPVLPDDDPAALQPYDGPPPELDPNNPETAALFRAVAAAMQYKLRQEMKMVSRPPVVL